MEPVAATVLLTLADACMSVGYWPGYFKVSSSVIIPKPGKPSYSTPRAFRLITLLNTLGKLIKKMISTRLQFDGVKFGLFHPHQFEVSSNGLPKMQVYSLPTLCEQDELRALRLVSLHLMWHSSFHL